MSARALRQLAEALRSGFMTTEDAKAWAGDLDKAAKAQERKAGA